MNRQIKRRLLNTVAVCVSASAFGFATGSAAADDYSWTGITLYGGVGGLVIGGDVSATDKTRYSAEIDCKPVPNQGNLGFTFCNEFGPVSTSPINSTTSDIDGGGGVLGTVGIGADFEPIRGVVLGAFADFEMSTSDSDFSLSSSTDFGPFGFVDANTDIKGSMDHEYSFSVGGRLGFVSLDRRSMAYLLLAYTQMNFDDPTATIVNSITGPFGGTLAADPITAELPDKFDGLTFGLGGEVKLTSLWTLRLEGRYTNLQSQSSSYSGGTSSTTSLGFTEFGSNCGAPQDCEVLLKTSANSKGSIDLDPDIISGRISIGFKLN